jgi:hypothetical protein
MNTRLSDEARTILAAAKEESRTLHHEYIGTEHLLLALLTHPPTVDTLAHFHLAPEQIRTHIHSLIQPGPETAPITDPPLTPRAQRSLDLATAESAAAHQKQIEPPHLLLGLLREDHGVAALALHQLQPTLTLQLLREQVFRIRLAQLRLIERTVRPLHAGTQRKLKIREELLAHLEAIYEQELTRTQNPDAAFTEAATRFGNPTDLTRELQSTVPAHERLSWHIEKRFGWRAPEHASKYLLRLSLQFLALFGIFFAAVAVTVIAIHGFTLFSLLDILYPDLIALLATPLALYLLGNLYFLTRDALFGVFGSPKSLRRVALLAAATFASTFAIGAAYLIARAGSLFLLERFATPLLLAAFLAALTSLLHARFRGPVEIQQTHWECLNLDAR